MEDNLDLLIFAKLQITQIDWKIWKALFFAWLFGRLVGRRNAGLTLMLLWPLQILKSSNLLEYARIGWNKLE